MRKDELEQMLSIIQLEPMDAGDTLMGSLAHRCVDKGYAKVRSDGKYISTPFGREQAANSNMDDILKFVSQGWLDKYMSARESS